MTEQAARARPSGVAISDAVFKTLVEGVLLLALAIAQMTMGLSLGALIVGTILLVIGSAGIGGVVTGLRNLGEGRRADA